MEILYLLIPLSIVLLGLIVWVFMWAIGSGQFDDLEGPAHRILMDEEAPLRIAEKKEAGGDTGFNNKGHDA
ncbi:MAG: cbb3-type cytochrome oxidase assembly protein CcoS [Gammaproteobacteria bacterium]|nr:cbb3-type cytochrome oxidase assembly protein CcoS [Gammaproteobacteria bacterium]